MNYIYNVDNRNVPILFIAKQVAHLKKYET